MAAWSRELARPAAGGRPRAGRRSPPGGAGAGRAGPRRLGQLPPAGRRLGRDAGARPARRRRSRRRCWPCCRRGGRPAAGYRHRHRPAAGIAGAAGRQALGVDASRGMLALARARLAARRPRRHCAVRQADMYRLPLPDAGFDVVVLQMVLHYAEDPRGGAGRGRARAAARRALLMWSTSPRMSAPICWSAARIAGPASTMPTMRRLARPAPAAPGLAAAGPISPARWPDAPLARRAGCRRGRCAAVPALTF